MNAKHTPTPWAIHNHFFITAKVGNRLKSVVCEIDRHAWTNSGEAQANAEHIVQCVNMHDELVEALEIALRIIDRDNCQTVSKPKLRDILSKAKEK